MADTDTESARVCPDCGRRIPRRSRLGLCPACVATQISADIAPVAAPDEPAAADVPGYLLERQLGEGAAGRVWLARELDPPRREVALKVLKPELKGGEAAVRFEAEMAALSIMDHPGVARVYAAGNTGEGQPFFAMELIRGSTITEYCEREKLGAAARLELFQRVCDAVGHAHRRGIIHRDLKPSNILVGEDGRPKVIDFGIAKATESLLTDATLLTQANQFLGTPTYMSPEQAEMRGEAIDTRSDIYSLGVVLYELLTGTTPFDAGELSGLPYDEALRKVRTESPPRPSTKLREITRSTTGVAPELSQPALRIENDVDWIVMKALEKAPDRRYETAAAFARDIGRYLTGGAIKARPPSTAYLLSKFAKRHWRGIAATGAVAAALVVATVVSALMSVRATRSEAELRREYARADFRVGQAEAEAGRPAEAAAYFARALRTDPANGAAASRLLSTLAGHSFAQLDLPPLEHGSFVTGAAWSADGTKLYSTGFDGVARIWDAGSGELLAQPYKDKHPLHAIALSPDGKQVSLSCTGGTTAVWAVGEDGLFGGSPRFNARGTEAEFDLSGARLVTSFGDKARAYDAATGELLGEFGEGKVLRGYAISPGGRQVATVTSEAAVIWDVATGEPVHRVGSTGNQPLSLCRVQFSPDGSRLVASFSGSAAGAFVIADTSTGEILAGTAYQHAPIVGLAISPDGTRIATAGGDGVGRLWSLQDGSPLAATEALPSYLYHVRFTSDGARVITAGTSNFGGSSARVWDAWNGQPLSAPIHHPEGAHCVSIGPDTVRLATGGRDQSLRVWDIRPRAAVPLRIEFGNPVYRAAFSADSQSVFATGRHGLTSQWDAATGAPLLPFTVVRGTSRVEAAAAAGRVASSRWIAPAIGDRLDLNFRQGAPSCAETSVDGERLYTGGSDTRLRAWQLVDGTLAFPPPEHASAVTAIAVDRAGRRVLCGCEDGALYLRSAADGSLLASTPTGGARIRRATFASGGDSVVAGDEDGAVWVWRYAGGAPAVRAGAHTRAVVQIALSSDGQLVATGSVDNTAMVWDVAAASAATAPLAHEGDTGEFGLLLAFSPDGSRLITAGSYDNTARVWDLGTGAAALPPLEHRSGVRALAVSADGALLATGGGSVRVWQMATGTMLAPPMRHGGAVSSIAFDTDAQRLVTAAADGSVRVWELPQVGGEVPDWLPEFAETYAGMRMTPAGGFEAVEQHHLDDLGEREVDAGLSRVTRWLSGDPDTRSVSPMSELARAEYVEQLIGRGTEASLRDALQLSPDYPRAMARLGATLVRVGEASPGRLAEADYLTGRAESMVPGDLTIAQQRAEVLGAVGRHGEALERNLRFLKLDPERPEAWLARGRLLEREGSIYTAYTAFAEAENLAKAAADGALAAEASGARLRLLPRFGSTTEVNYLRYQIMLAQPLPALDDREELETGLSDGARERLRLIELAADEPAAAMGELRKGLDAEPLNPMLWVLLGDLMERRGDAGDGAAAYRASLAALYSIVTPPERLQRVRDKLAALESAGDVPDDPEAAAAAIDLEPVLVELGLPQVPDLAMRAAYAYRRGDLALCEELAKRAIELRPDNHRFAITLAGCLYMTFNPLKWKQALGELDRAIALAEAADDQEALGTYLDGRQGMWKIIAESDNPVVRAFARASGAKEKAQRDLLLMKGIPARGDDVPDACLDLSSIFNATPYERFHAPGGGVYNSLIHLPGGVQDFGHGVPFDIRGLVHLQRAGWFMNAYYPRSATIPVGRKFASIHLLHAYGWDVPSGTVVGKYVVRYAGGDEVEVPLVCGENIGPWQIDRAERDSATPSHPRPHWAGEALSANPNTVCALYRLEWQNPHAGHEVVEVQFESAMTAAAPFLLAATVE